MCLRKSLSLSLSYTGKGVGAHHLKRNYCEVLYRPDAASHSKLSGSLQGPLSAPEAGPAGQSAQEVVTFYCRGMGPRGSMSTTWHHAFARGPWLARGRSGGGGSVGLLDRGSRGKDAFRPYRSPYVPSSPDTP
ncbi:hypothetical protein VTN00DRAFT_6052 [Thermoascus crustaceus]|uniref:uncharacterized protein n=1 Tax=Thermoascus crustaceus TaxID=5088 RepID=UPI00374457BA